MFCCTKLPLFALCINVEKLTFLLQLILEEAGQVWILHTILSTYVVFYMTMMKLQCMSRILRAIYLCYCGANLERLVPSALSNVMDVIDCISAGGM